MDTETNSVYTRELCKKLGYDSSRVLALFGPRIRVFVCYQAAPVSEEPLLRQ